MTRYASGPPRLADGTALKSNRTRQDMFSCHTPQGLEGERRKLDVHQLLEARREVFVNRGRRALLTALLYRGFATADDVRDAVPLPKGVNPKLFGVVPGPLARAGIVERIGFAASARADAHAQPVSVWRVKDRTAALAQLRDHPDRPDRAPCDDSRGQGMLF